MTTGANIGPQRFYFSSSERLEPPHIQVDSGDRLAKFWLQSITRASSIRFKRHDLEEVEKIIAENQARFLAAWHEHFQG